MPLDEEVNEVFYDGMGSHRRAQFFLDTHPGTFGASGRIAQEPSGMPPPFPIPSETSKAPTRIRDQLREKEKNVNLPEHPSFWKRLRRSFRNSFPTARVKSLSAVSSLEFKTTF